MERVEPSPDIEELRDALMELLTYMTLYHDRLSAVSQNTRERQEEILHRLDKLERRMDAN